MNAMDKPSFARVNAELPPLAVDYLYLHREEIANAVPKDGVGISKEDLRAYSAQPARTPQEQQLLGYSVEHFDTLCEFLPKGGSRIIWYGLQTAQKDIAAARSTIELTPLVDFLSKHSDAAGRDRVFSYQELRALQDRLAPQERTLNEQVMANFDRLRQLDIKDGDHSFKYWRRDYSENSEGITQKDMDVISRRTKMLNSLGVYP